MPRTIVVAGTHSGCGKTTAALALMATIRHRGLTVQPFKAGPDFIDPGYHELVTGRTGQNLDGWMMGEAGVREVFARHSAGADVAVVEGVMGLFDGADGAGEDGSTAQLAKWLGAPVLLVVDARSMARSAAAVVAGFAGFDPGLRLAGVLFNRVGSARHRELLEQAMASALPGVPVLGLLGRDEALALPSRHLGLVTAQDHGLGPEAVARLADWMLAGCNVGRVLALAAELEPAAPPEAAGDAGEAARPAPSSPLSAPPCSAPAPRVRIGVARDAAFCFYYAENLRLLEAAGAQLVFFSPLADAGLPPGLRGLYLGGGYPELHAARLAAGAPMRRAVRALAAAGAPVYAECGGFMYLMRALTDASGTEHPMCGVFPLRAAMAARRSALGYREVVTREAGILGPAWTMLRGHEFHYSHIADGPAQGASDEDADALRLLYRVRTRDGWTDQAEGFAVGNALGTYIHAHFASNPDVAPALVAACRAWEGAP
ncbi:cobyrinate a,c-diamide synthase [Desulfocurvus vexinensis]|uniref:cobyrinate a,c-diamide synthase n=1 Tax=Desulfocurvus vexinensis TaxID=399548 RepID=UPI0004915D83|nr:cobyrinate a,c-diamide synthase [Desulfocurvus vexinensis]